MSNIELALFSGSPSPYSLGLALTTPADPVPGVLVLNSESAKANLRLLDEGAQSNWRPTTPALKNGGVWTESNISNGRDLVSAPLGNVIETMRLTLVNPDVAPKAEIMTQVLRLVNQCRAFHASEFQTAPVYLGLQYDGAAGAQYALVYNIEVDMQIDPYIEENQSVITLAIEREPTWRGLPPGANPMLWGFYKKDWLPSSDINVTDTGQYDYSNLTFIGTLTSHFSLTDGLVYPFDEVGTSNFNYIDIPADLIDGDYPADALVNFKAKTTGVSKLHIARDTRTDLFPGNNNNATTQRKRNTFNGGDCTVTSVNPTSVKTIDANGVLSNGSIVNRYVLVLTYAVGTISGQAVASWSRVISQYPGRYAAFLRAQVTAGTVTNTKFQLQWATGASNINLQQTESVRLNQTGYGLTYLGDVDFTLLGSKYISSDGTGLNTGTTFELRLYTSKSSAETPTIKIWDLVLMPIDEPNGVIVINFASLGVNDYAFLDKTGYFAGGHIEDTAVTRQTSTDYQRRMTGEAISLIPGVTNRLYFLPDISSPAPTVPHEVQISLIPRWQGLRDV
jgi:hypothetical protein